MPAALFVTLALISLSATALTAALVGAALHGPATVALYHLEVVNTVLARMQIWATLGQAITLPGWLAAALLVAMVARGPAGVRGQAPVRAQAETSPVVRFRRADRASRQAPPAA